MPDSPMPHSPMPHSPMPDAGRGADPPRPSPGAGVRPRPVEEDPVARFERETLPWLPDVARFARALTRDAADADDLVQETYLSAALGWHTFRPGTDARRWLFSICHHAFVRTRRRERIYVHPEDDPEAEALAAVRLHVQARDAGLNDLFARLDLRPALAHALATLPAAFRAVVQLVDVQGLPYEDAAEVLGVPVGTVRSRLFRGRRLLQQELLVHGQDAGFAPGPARRADDDGGAMRRPTKGNGHD